MVTYKYVEMPFKAYISLQIPYVVDVSITWLAKWLAKSPWSPSDLRGIAAARQIDVDRADALLLQPVDVVLQGLGPGTSCSQISQVMKSATLDRDLVSKSIVLVIL
jgi:hypothetical protein